MTDLDLSKYEGHTPGLSCGHVSTINSKGRCHACQAELTREWRKANPKKARAQVKRWRAAKGPAHEAARRRRRRANNPETAKAAYQRRLTWLAGGDVSAESLRGIHLLSKGLCFYCGKSVRARFTPSDPRGFDHVRSRQDGGKHTASNIVVCCGGCNARKG